MVPAMEPLKSGFIFTCLYKVLNLTYTTNKITTARQHYFFEQSFQSKIY
jgi:hypothetical protein